MVRLVVTDMDNTLYPWVDYIVPAVEAMVDSVCRSTGFPRIRVVQALKAVYSKHESNEYPYALQESTLYDAFPDFGSFDKLVIEPARAAFADARRRYLRPFRGVLETLAALKERGVPVVALTDAPRNPAEYRVRWMGLDQYLKALYTLPGFKFPARRGEALIAPDIRRKDERGDYRAACPVVELPRTHEKPDPRGLMRICREQGIAPEDTLVVGDSIHKDVAVARKVGALDCWAEYGTYVSREYRERLDIISAAAITRRHAASVFEADAQRTERPSHALSNFGQLLSIIESRKEAESRAPRARARALG
ncbi:MAG TPA: HAD family hydrolase [Myxococcaceae bacterium]|nr:HAD family hydrolase [Myxococcaceae bacterium]